MVENLLGLRTACSVETVQLQVCSTMQSLKAFPLTLSAVQELVHPSSLLQHVQSNTLQIPQPQLSVTPMTPNFPTAQPLDISQEVLATWAKTASMILSNPPTPDSSQALTALGDQLAIHQWTEAAHAWYVISHALSDCSKG